MVRECRAELARAMLSRSLHSQCISQMHCKGTKNINAKQYFPPIIFKKFQMLKFALEIACRGAENHQEKFRKLRRKVEEIAKKSSENHVEKFGKSPRKVQKITWKSSENRQEKFRKSRGKVREIAKKSSENHVEKFGKSPREVQEIAWASVNTFIKPFNFFQGVL
jgi:hypothetical protein